MSKTSFSLVIPTYNRSNLLANTLKSLVHLKYPKRQYEVLIVDNNSTDQTKLIIKKFKKLHPTVTLKYLQEPQQGRSFSRNTGASFAQYSKVIFLDDDTEVQPNLLEQYARIYKKYPAAIAVGGKVVAKFAPQFRQFFDSFNHDELWILGHHVLGEKEKVLKYPETLFSANLSINLENWKDQLFDEMLGRNMNGVDLRGEDYELCLRMLLSKKGQVIYTPQIKASNVIESERFSQLYQIKRYFFSGIELFFIDQKLKKLFSQHRLYLPYYDFLRVFRLFKKSGNKLLAMKKFLKKLLFLIGYYVVAPCYRVIWK